MIKAILVGGPTYIGKSKFIDAVVERRKIFYRPHSYTTRPRRTDELDSEYEHISLVEFEDLKTSGLFRTVERVYGHYYATVWDSNNALDNSNKIAIKEIHPKNHDKLSKLFPKERLLSVLIMPRFMEIFWEELEENESQLSSERLKRIREDKTFYTSNNLNSYNFDIILYTDRFSNSYTLASEFLCRINDLIGNTKIDTELIETINRIGYGLIASEFSDDRRKTTAIFHNLSFDFFEEQINKYKNFSNSVLDIGTGRGYLLPLLLNNFQFVIALDISKEVLAVINQESERLIKICSSSFNLPFIDNSLKFVISSLADPSLTKETFNEISRILVDEGIFVLSTPPRIWSDAIRQRNKIPLSMTKFSHSSGSISTVYSFTYTDEELQQIMNSSGYKIEFFDVVYGIALRNYKEPIPPAFTEAANQLRIDLDQLPILQLVAGRKMSNS